MVPKESILRDIKTYWKSIDNAIENRILMIESKANLDLTVDAVAVLTDWEDFKSFDYTSTCVFDGRNFLKKNLYTIGH